MELTRQNSTRLQAGQTSIRLGMPLHLRFIFGLLLITLALVVGVTSLAKYNLPLSDPFAEYVNILPGQTLDRNLLEKLSCATTPVSVQTQVIYCERHLRTGIFSHIGLTIFSSRVCRLDLTVRPNALRFGDLVMLWGRPEVRLYRRSVSIAWPDRGITTTGWSDNERLSYFLPLQYISFYTTHET